jgi:SAM-dependent methyltransferase
LFLPFGAEGAPIRPNARCPRCQSLERHRLLWLYIQQRTDLLTAKLSVLHFAPEYFFQRKFSALPNLRYVAADLNPTMGMVRMDVTEIPCADASFDVVLCNHVLEHIPDDRRAMREILRILKPGGWAILQTPFEPERENTYEDPSIVSPDERKRAFGQEDHVRVYGRDYQGRLEESGFLVTVDDFARNMDAALRTRFGLMPDEDVFLCRKPAP